MNITQRRVKRLQKWALHTSYNIGKNQKKNIRKIKKRQNLFNTNPIVAKRYYLIKRISHSIYLQTLLLPIFRSYIYLFIVFFFVRRSFTLYIWTTRLLCRFSNIFIFALPFVLHSLWIFSLPPTLLKMASLRWKFVWISRIRMPKIKIV